MSPINVLSCKEYRGINRNPTFRDILTGVHTGRSRLPADRSEEERQASGIVVFWSMDEVKKEINTQGEEVKVRHERQFPLCRYYKVFNISQCDGLDHLLEGDNDNERIMSCDEIIRRNCPVVTNGEPAYSPVRDEIHMPEISLFDSSEAYYSTFFHELTHWSGHSSRLNRKGITETARFGSEVYSREELAAEMGSAFLSAMCRIDTGEVQENTAAYISGWLSHIKNSSAKDLIGAASDAQKAADFLSGVTPA